MSDGGSEDGGDGGDDNATAETTDATSGSGSSGSGSSGKGQETAAERIERLKAKAAAARAATGGESNEKAAALGPKGAAARVSAIHSQARPTFVVAGLFAVAAGIAALFDNPTGSWLPLHLLLGGTVLGAITAATQLLGVTWSSSPPPPRTVADVQRFMLFAGMAMVAVGRIGSPLGALTGRDLGLIGAGATAVVIALVLLIVDLVGIHRGAVTDRYKPALMGYVIAAVFGVVGVVLGATIASGGLESDYSTIRGVHLSANALGLVGIVIISTLPFFLATQARMKMAREATPARIRSVIVASAVAAAITLGGWLVESPVLTTIGFWSYALVLIVAIWLFPRIKRKQFDWAGPRLAQLAAGYLWWIAALVALGLRSLNGSIGDQTLLIRLVALMAIGGFAQIVSGSVYYFAPVIMAGNRKPGEGLRLTKSWVSLTVGNTAAVGIALDVPVITAVSVAVWLVDTAYRLLLVVRFNRRNNAAERAVGTPPA